MLKKKILYIHHSGSNGGAPRSLALMIQKLDKNKYDPIVLTIRNGPPVELFKKCGAKVIVDEKMHPFHGSTVSGMTQKLFINNLLYAYPTYLRAKRIIRVIDPDIVHLNTTCLFMFAKAARDVLDDVKIITHVREPLLDSMAGKILEYMNHKYVDAYISISKYDESTVNTNNRISEIIYNFVDFKNYNSNIKSNKLKEELKINENSILFLYLARIAPSNGTLELISMAEKVIQKFPNYHFAIVGYDKSTENLYMLKAKEKSNSVPNIHLLEFRNDVPEVIASSNVVVCPFIEPHFSRAIIEASAMGIPSLATDIGGPNELIVHGETGLLFELNNYNSFYEAIVLLGENESLRNRMGTMAEKFAWEKFNGDINTKKVFDLYDNLLMGTD